MNKSACPWWIGLEHQNLTCLCESLEWSEEAHSVSSAAVGGGGREVGEWPSFPLASQRASPDAIPGWAHSPRTAGSQPRHHGSAALSDRGPQALHVGLKVLR